MLVAVVIVGTALGCRSGDGDSAEGAGGDAPQPTVAVKTAVVTTGPFTETLGAIGTVTGRAGHVASLSAPVQARIARVLVSAGQRVAKGAALVELEQAPFRAAEQSAAAALTAAERSFERAQRLVAAGIVPRKDLDQATADLAQARANLATARRASELSVLRSPLDGVVTAMTAMLGASADANQPLVEVADPSALDVLLSVTPTDAGRIHAGAAVEMMAGQSAAGESLGTGRVADVGGTVDTASRSVTVRVQLPSSRRPLRIGETVYGEIAVATHAAAVMAPVEALVPDGETFKVFVVDSAGVAHGRPVAIGGRTDKVAEITSGLAAGERIVTYGAYGVDDSVRVVPIGGPAPAKP
jgi:membrane fusion protein (multidrug efflux system)